MLKKIVCKQKFSLRIENFSRKNFLQAKIEKKKKKKNEPDYQLHATWCMYVEQVLILCIYTRMNDANNNNNDNNSKQMYILIHSDRNIVSDLV